MVNLGHLVSVNFRTSYTLVLQQKRMAGKYGEPMEIQRFKASTQYTKPVEIWIYAVEGTSEFVFVDRIGGDQFTLMHSSHPDEYHNPDWAETLQ